LERISYEKRSLPDLMMGIETPIPPFAMDAAAPEGAHAKNPDGFFFNQSSLMRRPILRGGSIS
jgi:hypothetical protein